MSEAARLKTYFFGTPDFALASLEATYKNSALQAVICQPDRPRGRGQKLSPCPVKEFAQQKGVKIFSPASLRKASPELEELRSFMQLNPADLFVVTAYGNLLTQEFLDAPQLGAVNVHASLLPRWRGAAPIQRALEAGDKISGVALQKMVMALDAGDVLLEKKLAISETLDANDLTHSLSQLGGEILHDFFKSLDRSRELSGLKQDESQITLAPKIKKEEGEWKLGWSLSETHNRIRAFKVWPGVRAKLHLGEEIKFVETEIAPFSGSARPGEIQLIDGKAWLTTVIRTGENPTHALWIKRIQPANKGPVSAFDYLQNLAKKEKEALKLL